MTDPIAASVAPSLLRVVLQRALVVGAAAGVVGGGARLAQDEVTLARTSSEAQALRAQLGQAGAEARRAARLELDLAHLREEARALEASRALGQRRVQDLEAAVASTRQALGTAEQERDAARADATQSAALVRAREEAVADLSAKLDEQVRALDAAWDTAERAAAEAERLGRDLAATTVALEAAREREGALAADLQGARTQAGALATDLEAERRRAAEREQALAALKDELADAEGRARRDAERLERLARAGVNVPRLTGERPMPRVDTLVVNVDGDAVPPVVVVHAGQPDGLERGDLLVVLRDGQELARLEVDEVRGPYSTARVVRASRGARVRPGDQVRSASR